MCPKQDEWANYKAIRERCKFNTTWMEVVGNHDIMMQFVSSSHRHFAHRSNKHTTEHGLF